MSFKQKTVEQASSLNCQASQHSGGTGIVGAYLMPCAVRHICSPQARVDSCACHPRNCSCRDYCNVPGLPMQAAQASVQSGRYDFLYTTASLEKPRETIWLAASTATENRLRQVPCATCQDALQPALQRQQLPTQTFCWTPRPSATG